MSTESSRRFRRADGPTLTVSMSETDVAIRSRSSSTLRTARILGRRVMRDHGVEMEAVYLDRLVHKSNDDVEGWALQGAISTILLRPLPCIK